MSFPYNPITAFGKENYVRCPFNSEHAMCESSLQRHILRCMIKHPHYVSCPYNALHFFKNKDLLEKHLQLCPCKPLSCNKSATKDHQEELIHAANLRNLRYWNMEYENWDKD